MLKSWKPEFRGDERDKNIETGRKRKKKQTYPWPKRAPKTVSTIENAPPQEENASGMLRILSKGHKVKIS